LSIISVTELPSANDGSDPATYIDIRSEGGVFPHLSDLTSCAKFAWSLIVIVFNGKV